MDRVSLNGSPGIPAQWLREQITEYDGKLADVKQKRLELAKEEEHLQKLRESAVTLYEEKFGPLKADCATPPQQPELREGAKVDVGQSLPVLCVQMIRENANRWLSHQEILKRIQAMGREIHPSSVSTAIKRLRDEKLVMTKSERGLSYNRLTETGMIMAEQLASEDSNHVTH